jgi:hypothetical protein
MKTLGDIATDLHRPVVYLHGLMTRFELPLPGAGDYPASYQAFLGRLVYLRVMNVSEDSLRDLWSLEKKLLRLLHADTTGSSTWYLDACGQANHPRRRLLLSNFDMGVELDTQSLQPGLNFAAAPVELFPGTEMGEDALRLLSEVQALTQQIKEGVRREMPVVKAAMHWAKTGTPPSPIAYQMGTEGLGTNPSCTLSGPGEG